MLDNDSRLVLVLVGSLRAASVNRRLAELAVEVAPAGARFDIFNRLGELPFYNEDLDATSVPEPAEALRRAAAGAAGALIVTPEYNGSIPAVLKNAIDWLSRPYGDGALKAKPVAVVGASQGRYGGKWAHDETRKSVAIAGSTVVEGLDLSVPFDSLNGRPPREHGAVVTRLRFITDRLVSEIR